MEFAKFTGKTLDEALNAACNAKGCTKEELHYEVTEEKSGFLGIGKQLKLKHIAKKILKISLNPIFKHILIMQNWMELLKLKMIMVSIVLL